MDGGNGTNTLASSATSSSRTWHAGDRVVAGAATAVSGAPHTCCDLVDEGGFNHHDDQDIVLPVKQGESFLCRTPKWSRQATTQGARCHDPQAPRESRSQKSSVGFGPLPGKNQWTHVSTCVTASQPHSGGPDPVL